MNTLLIFIWVYSAMIAMGFWEAYVEGRNPWDQRKVGWKIKFGKYVLTGYHFFLFIIMLPLLLTLPLVIYGWDLRVFGILLSAYASGIVIEDFTWFLANPTVNIKKDFNPRFASYYPWFKIGRFKIPLAYILLILFALLSWYFIWR